VETTTKTHRPRRPRKSASSTVIRLEIQDSKGHPRWVTADVVDLTDAGLALELVTPLRPGATLVVRGKLGENGTADGLKAEVRWCTEKAEGGYRAGLEFLHNRSTFTADEESRTSINPDILDCYEVMQLSPNADLDTINRVYRILAARYHPDNTATGNREMFLQLSEAHQILSDPERRASYDVNHRESKQLRWKIFDQASESIGSEGEKRKRKGILAVLYAKVLNDPEQAEMSIQLIEELLGCPREHLQSAFWYLKGKNYIRRGDNGRFSITIAGFEEAEAQRGAGHLQLAEPARTN
jgi:curved DNA-binding protein